VNRTIIYLYKRVYDIVCMLILCVCVYALIYIVESSYLIIRLGESQHCYCIMCVYAYLNVYC